MIDFERVLTAHRPRVEVTGFIHGCSCDEWDRADLTGSHAAHLSAALHAELARWLREDVTKRLRGMATEQFDRTGPYNARGAAIWDVAAWLDEHVATALAALTTTDQEDHR